MYFIIAFGIILMLTILELGHSDFMQKSFVAISSFLSIISLCVIVIIRFVLAEKLTLFVSDQYSFLITLFDKYAIISITAMLFIIGVLIYFLRHTDTKYGKFVFDKLSLFVPLYIVINFIYGIYSSLGTINKCFDVGTYILVLCFCEIFLSYIPLIYKKLF